MPNPEVEALDKSSGEAQVKAAISACIATEIRAGKTPDEAKGMCYGMVKDKTGVGTVPGEEK